MKDLNNESMQQLYKLYCYILGLASQNFFRNELSVKPITISFAVTKIKRHVVFSFNTSYLKNYPRSGGVFEISLMYAGEKDKSFIKAITKC